MGFTDPDAVVDDRPVVIFEAMEGLGQALAVARVLERVARVGVACAYDRAGFGWSDPFASHQRRGPDNIAQVAPVYVCVCMHACMHVCMHACIYSACACGRAAGLTLLSFYFLLLFVLAQELHYLLTANNISVLIPPRTGATEPAVHYVRPPFVLVGHSTGSLYARTFASLYAKDTAAVVQWDPLPSQDRVLGVKFTPTTARKLPQVV